MSTIIPISRPESIADLRSAIKQSSDEAQKTRIRAIIKIKSGVTRTEVAQEYVVERGTIIDWITAYNTGGPDALLFSKGGRPEGNPVWNTSIFDALIEEIEKQEHYWSVPLMVKWIKKNHHKDIPENTLWYHVTGLKYSYKSARPHPHLGNKAQQEVFKKGASVKN
jgi:transposase